MVPAIYATTPVAVLCRAVGAAGAFWARRALVLSAVCYVAFLYLFWRLGRNLGLPGPTLSIGQVCWALCSLCSLYSHSGQQPCKQPLVAAEVALTGGVLYRPAQMYSAACCGGLGSLEWGGVG